MGLKSFFTRRRTQLCDTSISLSTATRRLTAMQTASTMTVAQMIKAVHHIGRKVGVISEEYDIYLERVGECAKHKGKCAESKRKLQCVTNGDRPIRPSTWIGPDQKKNIYVDGNEVIFDCKLHLHSDKHLK